jgi:small-conductance mechanosensitive channel
MRTFLEQWAIQIINTIPRLLAALVIFLISIYVARVLRNLLKKVLEKRNAPVHITKLLIQTVYWAMLVIGLLTALERIFDVTAFLAGLGILGLTIGFALQDVMKNLAAGIILLIQKPFSLGDEINIEGFDGTILSIDLRATEIETFDGRLVTIPNAAMLTSAIVNYTRANRRRVDIQLAVSKADHTEMIRKSVLAAIQAIPGFVSEPAPTVLFQRIDDNSINLICTFWIDLTRTNPQDAQKTASSLLKEEFEQGDITLSPKIHPPI